MMNFLPNSMKGLSRVLLFPALLSMPLFLGGCTSDGSTLAALRENPILRNAARAVLMGKAFDRAAIARRNGLAVAEQMVTAAAQLDRRAQLSKDQTQKKTLEAQANQKYREALRILPDFPSRNADLLNALGYFLADRGDSKNDFQTAERLTRASLTLWDASVKEVEGTPMSGEILAARKFMRANTRDSLAWALFRQGKFQNAKAEQLNALKEAEVSAGQINEKVPADLYFHLGGIERALKNFGAARKQYEAALKVEPKHAPSTNALKLLPEDSTSDTPDAKKNVPDNSLPELERPDDFLPDDSSPVPTVPDRTLQARSTPVTAVAYC